VPVPVPVWLTLGGWNPLTESLHEWATATMTRDHPFLRAPDYGADAAGELLRTGWVTLFLDGLDELPENLQSAALRRVDEARGLRIVLSSRAAGPGVGLDVRELGQGLAGGLLFGLAIGMLTLWATRIARSPSATPAATYRSDRRTERSR
jgi:hypothetical protein